MKKKKTLLLILLFVLTLVGTLGLFTFIIVKSYNDNKTYYYVATKDFEAKTEITELDVSTYFAKVEGTKEYAETLSNNGIVLVTNLNDLIGRTVTIPISAGDIVSYAKFNDVIEGNVESDFKNPQYIPLSFEASNILAREVTPDSNVAIMIDTSLNNLAYATQTATSAATSTAENTNTSNSDALDNASKGRLLSVVCTKAIAKKIEVDKSGKYNILLQMEYEDALNLLSLSSTSTLYLLDNQRKTITEKTSLINYNVLANTFASTGLDVSLTDFECWVSRLNENGSIDSTFKFDSSENVATKDGLSEKLIMPTKLDASAKVKNIKIESYTKLQLQWFSYVPYIYIKHYDENGQEVNDYGKYTVANNDFSYNSKTEKSTLKLELTNGVYEVGFFNADGSLAYTYVFTIEKPSNYTYTTINNEKIKISSIENSTYSYSLAISKALVEELANSNGLEPDSFMIDGDNTKYDLNDFLTLNDDSYYYVATKDTLNFSTSVNNTLLKTIHFYSGEDELDNNSIKTFSVFLKDNKLTSDGTSGLFPIFYSSYSSDSGVNYNTLSSTEVTAFQKEYYNQIELLRNVQVNEKYDLARIFNFSNSENFELNFENTAVSGMNIVINERVYSLTMNDFNLMRNLVIDNTIEDGIAKFDDEGYAIFTEMKEILSSNFISAEVNNLDLIKIFLLFKGQYSNILNDVTIVLKTVDSNVSITLQQN